MLYITYYIPHSSPLYTGSNGAVQDDTVIYFLLELQGYSHSGTFWTIMSKHLHLHYDQVL